MKKVIGLVVIVPAVVLGSYFGMGLLTKVAIDKSVRLINESNGVLVEIDKYDRGLYTSTAVLKWNIHIAEILSKNSDGQITTVPAQDYKLETPLTIYHGPVMFTNSGIKFGLGYARSDVSLPEDYATKFADVFTKESIRPKLNVSLFVNYLDNSQFHVDLPAFKLIFKDTGDQIVWNGMNTHLQFSRSFRHIDGGFTIDGAMVTKDKMKANITKLVSDYEMKRTKSGIYIGEGSLSMSLLSVMDNDKPMFEVNDFFASSNSGIDDRLFHSNFKSSIKKCVLNGKVYGPGLIEFGLSNLDADILADIHSKSPALQQGSDADRQQALLAILPEIPKLFAKGPQFEVSTLKMEVPEGTITGKLLLSLPKGDAGNPFQMLQKLVGHSTLEIPMPVIKDLLITSLKQANPAEQVQPQKVLDPAIAEQMKNSSQANGAAKQKPGSELSAQTETTGASKVLSPEEQMQKLSAQADEKLSAMIREGTLVKKDKNYLIELDLAQGQLTVNGKPFTPAMIQF